MYYIYAYLREDGSPYYVGKGKDNRAWSKCRTVSMPTQKERITFLIDNLTEDEAFQWEKFFISAYGRKDNGTGILINRTDGGEGISGFKQSPESIAKRVSKTKGQKRPNTSQKLKGQIPWHKGKVGVYSEETLRKMRKPKANKENYRKPKSEEHKQKMRESALLAWQKRREAHS